MYTIPICDFTEHTACFVFFKCKSITFFRKVGRSRLSEGVLFPTNKSYSSLGMTWNTWGTRWYVTLSAKPYPNLFRLRNQGFFFLLLLFLVFNKIPLSSILLWYFAGPQFHRWTWWLDLMSDGILIQTVTECTKGKVQMFPSIWISMCDGLGNQLDVTVVKRISAH